MTKRQARQYEMLVRVRDFGEAHKARFPESSVGGPALAAVGAAVTQLSEHAVSKMSARREGTTSKAMARAALKERLEMIGRTARGIAAEVPGFADPFRLPKLPSDQTLLTAGRVFLHEAEPLKTPFIAHGVAPAFLEELRDLVERFEQAIRGRQAGKSSQTAARAGIEAALTAGLAALRKLDVIVKNQFHGDVVALAVWRRDRRLEQRSRPARSKPTGSAGAEAVQPTPPAGADVALKVAS